MKDILYKQIVITTFFIAFERSKLFLQFIITHKSSQVSFYITGYLDTALKIYDKRKGQMLLRL